MHLPESDGRNWTEEEFLDPTNDRDFSGFQRAWYTLSEIQDLRSEIHGRFEERPDGNYTRLGDVGSWYTLSEIQNLSSEIHGRFEERPDGTYTRLGDV
jgi:hypothetical protein